MTTCLYKIVYNQNKLFKQSKKPVLGETNRTHIHMESNRDGPWDMMTRLACSRYTQSTKKINTIVRNRGVTAKNQPKSGSQVGSDSPQRHENNLAAEWNSRDAAVPCRSAGFMAMFINV
jgi:hypothetical protein